MAGNEENDGSSKGRRTLRSTAPGSKSWDDLIKDSQLMTEEQNQELNWRC